MKKVLALMVVVAVAALVFVPLAFATDVQGKVKTLDQSGRWLTLEDGIQLMIPATTATVHLAARRIARAEAGGGDMSQDGHSVSKWRPSD